MVALFVGAVLHVALAGAQPHEVVVFDFERGIDGWWGNAWGGGECRVEPAPEAKFGGGALRVVFEDVRKGANGVSPFFPDDAPWRSWEIRYVSFWVRGSGQPCQVRFAILASGPDGKEISYSRWFTVSGQRWQRVLISTSSFFQRQHIPFSARRVRRMVFGGIGTSRYDVDQVCFHPPTHFLPLLPVGDTGPAPLKPRLEHFPDEAYELCFDPTLFPADEVHVAATVAWPGERAVEFGGYMPGRGAKGEARVKLPGAPARPGQARISLRIQERQGQVMYRGNFTAMIVLPETMARPSRWQLVPQPKQLEFRARYAAPRSIGPIPGVPANVGIEERSLEVVERRWRASADIALPDIAPVRRPEAYVVDIAPDWTVVRGRGQRALHWAVRSASELATAEYLLSGRKRVPSVSINDWPALPVRGVAISLPVSRWGHPNDPPVDPDFFVDFLDRCVAGLKLNLLVLMLDQGMELETHPEVSGPAAWPKETVARIVARMRRAGVEVVPLLNCLGHANWLNASHPELREDGDLYTLCTSHPAMRQVLGDIIDEVVRLLSPRYFHIGMDEVRWKTLKVAPEKRCKLCAGKAKADIFAEQVRMLHDFLAERGVKTMMWGDMLVAAHNGGPPFNVASAIDKIPKDIVICNWSSSIDPLSSWWFRSQGFERVIKSNSRGCNAADAAVVWGNMWGVWDKVPWLVEKPGGYNRYNFLNILVAAQYSWNLYPDVFHGVGLTREFFAERPVALARLGLARVRRAAEFYAWARRSRPEKLGPETAITDTASFGPAEIGGAQGRWLGLITALECTAEQLSVLRERLKAKTAWMGAPAGTVTFHYTDGTQERAILRFGYHFRAAGSEGLPYVYAAVALEDPAGWYAIPIENPRPKRPLKQVTVQADPQAGTLHVGAARLFAE